MYESNAEERADNASATAKNAGAAQDDGGDDFEFLADADVGFGGILAGGDIDGDDSGDETRERVDGEFDAVDLEAGEAGGGFVEADGVEGAAEAGFPEDNEGEDGEEDEDPAGDFEAVEEDGGGGGAEFAREDEAGGVGEEAVPEVPAEGAFGESCKPVEPIRKLAACRMVRGGG